MSETKIEWTESTWNPVTGCTKISAGCANCYAERMARRLQIMGQPITVMVLRLLAINMCWDCPCNGVSRA